nr:hypothetical protein [Propionibacterium sp.]
MRRSGLVATLFCLALAGCQVLPGPPPVTGPAPGASPSAAVTPTLDLSTPAPTATPSVTASVPVAPPALGKWTPTCSDAAADSAALVGNLTAQPAFAGARPSSVAGFGDAAASAVRPLYDCPVAHSLRVKDAIRVGSDADATSIVRTKLAALLRTVVLTLSGTKVGRFPFGSVTLGEARPVLVAVLGEPDETNPKGGCVLDEDGAGETTLRWGSFLVAFDNRAGGALRAWQLRPTLAHPKNLELAGGLPFRATFAELRASVPSLTYSAIFANDAPPYAAEPRTHLYYIWDGAVTAKSDGLAGGTIRACD